MQELSLQPNPEVVLGAAGGAAHEHPLQQTALPVPSELAPSGTFDWSRLVEVLNGFKKEMKEDMKTNTQDLRSDMDANM